MFALSAALATAIVIVDCGGGSDEAPSPPTESLGSDAASIPPVPDATSDVADTDSGVVPAACSPDLSRDPENCGRCGHGCLGGACSGGKCQPVVLADNVQDLGTIMFGIALSAATLGRLALLGQDQDEVYFVTADGVFALPKKGGPRRTVVNRPLYMGSTFAMDDTYVYGFGYGATPDKVVRLRKHDGGVAEVVASRFTGSSNTIALPGDGFVYSCEDGDTGLRVSQAVADAGSSFTAFASLGNVNAFASDGTYVYLASNYGVFKAPRTGADGGAPTLVTDLLFATNVVFDRGELFFVSPFAGTVQKVDPTGAVVSVAVSQWHAFGLAVDAQSVYFGTEAGVMACPRTGCGTAARLIASAAAPNAVVVDDEAVYYASPRGGLIGKVAK